MSKKKKTIIGTTVVIVVILVVGLFIWSPWKTENPQQNETTTTTTVAADDGIAIQTTPTNKHQEETTTEKKWTIEPKLFMYFRTPEGFVDAEFTDRTFTKLEEAKTIAFADSMKVNGEYAEPEVRLYGVPLGAFVTVTCESVVTKAHYVEIGQNDGSYQYYYWQPRLYSVTDQGEYIFKVSIKETEHSDNETVIYYKVAV